MIILGATKRTKETPSMALLDRHPSGEQTPRKPEDTGSNHEPSVEEREYGGPINPNDFNEKKDGDPRRRRGLTRVTAIALSAAGVAGVAAGAYVFGTRSSEKVGTQPSIDTTTSVPVTPPIAEVTPTLPPATSEMAPDPTGMSPELVAEIDGESYGQFTERPYTEQVQYGVEKVRLLSEEGYLFDFVDQETANNNSLANYNFIDNPTTELSTMDVPLQNLYINQIIVAWKKTNPGPKDGAGLGEFGNGKIDKLMAKKLASLYAVPGTKDYQGMIETILNKNKKTGEEQDFYAGRIDDGDGSKDAKGHTDVKAYYGKEIVRPLYEGTLEIDGKPATYKMKDYLVHTDAGDKVITYAAIPIADGNVVWPSVKTVNPSEYNK